MNQNEHGPSIEQESPPDESQDTEEQPKGSPVGVGVLLKNEREERGLSYDRISETTKLRPPILEAIENQDWDQLPSPVFVTGFIRSYARALGLDEEKLVDLYHRDVPREPAATKPLMEPVRTRKSLPIICVVLLVSLACAYYLWNEYPGREKILAKSKATAPKVDQIVKPESGPETRKAPKQLLPENIDVAARSPEIKKEEPPPEPVKEPVIKPAVKPVVKKEKPEPVIEEYVPDDYEFNPEIETLPFTLKAEVKEKTWMRISVDGEKPREYIFIPGNRREWNARERFELFIGNADGIVFEFNGEKINNLGKSGEVVHLVLPDYFVRGDN